MDELIKGNLEDYLSGALRGKQKERIDAFLAHHPGEAEELLRYEESARLLRSLRVGEDEAHLARPEPGFYARVLRTIEEEQSVPFWTVFLEPFLLRRLAFACLMWFALLGSYIAVFQGDGEQNPHVAERMLVRTATPEFQVRLGSDLQRNRDSMLSVMMVSVSGSGR